MIISASRRTDIPAFFGDWFMRRVAEGFFVVANPWNPAQVAAYSLAPADVDAIAFWTKDPAPFMENLDVLDTLGYRYYFGVTLNDYPPALEPGVPPLAKRVETFQRLSERVGRKRVIWRYDPIIISSATPVEYHRERLTRLARSLSGHTDRLIISFLDFYARVRPRLARVTERSGIVFTDIVAPAYRQQLLALAADISRIGAAAGIAVQSCCEPVDLSEAGVKHGACIDGEYIESVLGAPRRARPRANQRGACLCAHSIDMGAYNTCRFGCEYCYANHSAVSVRANGDRHFADSPALLGRPAVLPEIRTDPLPFDRQLKMPE